MTQGEAYARECICGKAGGQRRDRSKRVHGVKTVEKIYIFDLVGREIWCNVRCAWAGD